MDKQELLLAVLDLSEGLAIRRLYDLGYTDYFVKLACGRDGTTYRCRIGSLADLAFRLRDGIVYAQCRYGEDFETVALAVQNYVLHPPPNPQLGKNFQDYLDAVRASSMWVDNSNWWMRKAEPIHWIVAVLIVKELTKC